MIERLYLLAVGVLYAGLAIWCAVDPDHTSQAVGFSLNPGAGDSEFLTVYGGLEMGLAAILWLPLFDRQATRFSLTSCFLIHLSLVIFRSISLVIYSVDARMTYQLAVGEWVILLTSAYLLWRHVSDSAPTKTP